MPNLARYFETRPRSYPAEACEPRDLTSTFLVPGEHLLSTVDAAIRDAAVSSRQRPLGGWLRSCRKARRQRPVWRPDIRSNDLASQSGFRRLPSTALRCFKRMMKITHRFALLPLIVSLAATPLSAQSTFDQVDPMIGTGGDGHTFPGAVAPFGMVQFSPDTDATCVIRNCYSHAVVCVTDRSVLNARGR